MGNVLLQIEWVSFLLQWLFHSRFLPSQHTELIHLLHLCSLLSPISNLSFLTQSIQFLPPKRRFHLGLYRHARRPQ